MSTRYPCPNPTCIHEFADSELVGAVSLKCPVCGMVLQLRAAPATAVSATIPMAQPVQHIPMATAVSVPMAQPAAPSAAAADLQTQAYVPGPTVRSNTFVDDGAPIVRGTRAPKRRDWVTYTAVIGGFCLFVAFGVGAYLVGFKGGSVGDSGFVPARSTDFNVQFQSPGKPWSSHEGLKAALPASILAMHRENPTAWMAIDAKKYDHDPSALELDGEARRKLGRYLRNLETDPPTGAAIRDGEATAGQKSSRFVFLGDMYLREQEGGEKQFERVSGECVMFKFQGIGYWIYTWMPLQTTENADAMNLVAAQFKEIRGRVGLLGDRAEWKQQGQRRTVFAGKSADYQLVDRMGRWQVFANEDPKERDDKADMVLFAPSPTARNIIERLQTSKVLTVLIIPGAADGIGAAQQYLLQRYQKESDKATMEPADEGMQPAALANDSNGKMMQWKMSIPQGRSTYVVAAVAPRDKDLVVAFAECDWNERNANEVLFQSIVGSLQKKTE